LAGLPAAEPALARRFRNDFCINIEAVLLTASSISELP
jgi:hypothetical protein